MKRVPDLVSEESTEEILELSKSIVMRKMVDPVRNALDLFEKNISRLIFLPDIPHIEFRVETMKILIESLSREMKGSVYAQFMRETGKRIGKSLGHSMMEFLMNNNKLPKSDSVLTKLWNEWDMVAGWGKIKTVHEDGRVIMAIEDGWLTRCAEGDKHRHCPFMEGYIYGFLWIVIKERYRWFKRSVAQPSHPPLEPFEVVEKPEGDRCIFNVRLREEELQDAFDALSDAREYMRLGNFDQVSNSIRISLELALKNKVGISKDDRTSVVKVMKALKGMNVQLKYKAIDEIYNLTSRVMHGSKKPDARASRELISRWDDIIEEIELLELPERENIRKKIMAM